MNSFFMDLKRAILSVGFCLGLLILIFVLNKRGVYSDLFRICVPIVSTLPYSIGWLVDYKSGYLRYYIVRTNMKTYILGKICSCGISGGLVVAAAVWIFETFFEIGDYQSEYILLFLTGALWAVLSATLAVWTNNQYIAYGGSFVICYLLVILHDRYFQEFYYIYPYEWMCPENVWVFENNGIVLLLLGIIVSLVIVYYGMVRRRIRNV